MAQVALVDRRLAEAVSGFVDYLHHRYSGIRIKSVSNCEDEDIALEITIPGNLSADEVLETCHAECIKAEDDYDLFILPHVVYE